ncbi:hypothetical protein MPTK1_6g10800 [Marchantia polymorpha subsp. ruderalis]
MELQGEQTNWPDESADADVSQTSTTLQTRAHTILLQARPNREIIYGEEPVLVDMQIYITDSLIFVILCIHCTLTIVFNSHTATAVHIGC